MEQTFTFKFSVDELNAIMEGLSSLPWRAANPVILSIQEQARKQQEGQAEEAVPKE